jgi:F-type H+-transporting ATPase subunit b
MNHALTILAQTNEAPGGLAALGLDVKYFLFQLASFVIVLLVLRKWVFPKLVATLEERRLTVEKSLEQAKEAEASLNKAEKQITALLHEAQERAEGITDTAHKKSLEMIEAAESKASKRAQHIVTEAQAQIAADLRQARESLKQETAQLVAYATEQIIKEKVDVVKNGELINTALARASQENRK